METALDYLFQLLREKPILSIILLFALVGYILWLFRDVIRNYLLKKLDLYTGEEIAEAYQNIASGDYSGKSTNVSDFLEEIKRIREDREKS